MGIEEGECFGFLGPNGYHNFTTLSTNFSFSQNEQNIFWNRIVFGYFWEVSFQTKSNVSEITFSFEKRLWDNKWEITTFLCFCDWKKRLKYFVVFQRWQNIYHIKNISWLSSFSTMTVQERVQQLTCCVVICVRQVELQKLMDWISTQTWIKSTYKWVQFNTSFLLLQSINVTTNWKDVVLSQYLNLIKSHFTQNRITEL